MSKCPRCGKELILKDDAYVCDDCMVMYTATGQKQYGSQKLAENTVQKSEETVQKPAETVQKPAAPELAPKTKKKRNKKIRKTKEERQAELNGLRCGKVQYAMGMLMLLFGIIPGIVFALGTGNKKTIAGMKMGLVILLILAVSAGIITGLVFAGMAINLAIEKNHAQCARCDKRRNINSLTEISGEGLVCEDCYELGKPQGVCGSCESIVYEDQKVITLLQWDSEGFYTEIGYICVDCMANNFRCDRCGNVADEAIYARGSKMYCEDCK